MRLYIKLGSNLNWKMIHSNKDMLLMIHSNKDMFLMIHSNKDIFFNNSLQNVNLAIVEYKINLTQRYKNVEIMFVYVFH